MTNIEIPENIIALAKKILEDSVCYGDNSLELANFITAATRPTIEVENFVVYKVKCADKIYAGFRFSSELCWKKWSLVEIDRHHEAGHAIPQFNTAILVDDQEVEVLERWTPEPEFGIGEAGDEVTRDREVLVKGHLISSSVDSDGDVYVKLMYSDSIEGSSYVSAKDVAYAEEVADAD